VCKGGLLLGTHFNEIKNLRHFCRVKHKNSSRAAAVWRLTSPFSSFLVKFLQTKICLRLELCNESFSGENAGEGGGGRSWEKLLIHANGALKQ